MTIAGGTPPTISFGGVGEFVLTGNCKPEIDDGIVVNPESNADGGLRKLYEIGPGMITGIEAACTPEQYEKLVEAKNNVAGYDMSLELIDGQKYVTTEGANPVNLRYNPASATCSFDVAGSRPGRTRAWLKRV
jgi:hypothetical protein